MVIDLTRLEKPVIDLAGVTGVVELVGDYTGARIVVKNADGVFIRNRGFVSIRTEQEEALVLDNPRGVVLTGIDRGLVLHGALQVWNECAGLTVDGLVIQGAHTGIRCNQKHVYSDIIIRNCLITDCSHEGVYLGHFARHDSPATGVVVERNDIMYCGWDGLQIGNAAGASITGNRIYHCGQAGTKWQDFSLCLNPGFTGTVYGNTLIGKVQCITTGGVIRFSDNEIRSGVDYAVFIKSMKDEKAGSVVMEKNRIEVTGLNTFLYIQEGEEVEIIIN